MALIDAETTDAKLTSDMVVEIPDSYQKTVGYFAWDFCRAVAIVLLALWDKVLYIVKALADISNFSYEDVVRFVWQRRGVKAIGATCSSGLLKVTSGSGWIDEGALFETPDGLQFVATETKNVALNGTFKVECLTSGIVGNVPANTITVIPETITGIGTVTNPEAMTGGYEAESKSELIAKYYEDLQNPVASGNIYFYKKIAKSVAGVGDADVKPLWNGANTVKVILVDSNFEPASDELVAQVQNIIDPYTLVNGVKVGWGCGNGEAPLGAYCTVEKASKLELEIVSGISLKTGEDLSVVTERVRENIKTYIKSIAFKEGENNVSYAKIVTYVTLTEGVADCSSELTVNGGKDNIAILNNATDHNTIVIKTLTLTEI